MYITDMELINAKVSAMGAMNISDVIRRIIEEDEGSPEKLAMKKGENYYNAKHDSLLKQYNEAEISETENIDGREVERTRLFKNPNRSNHHNINPFHRTLVEQKVSYMVGREPTISVLGAEKGENRNFEEMLREKADEEFNETIQDWVRGASNKGQEALHFYYDEEGNLKYAIVPAGELIAVYDSAYQRELEQVIRYYAVKVIKNGREYWRRKVEWWTKNDVTYYVEKEKDLFVLDGGRGVNPMPHWWDISLKNGLEKKRTPHSWGRVPFIFLENNRYRTSDLENIKSLIDAYDYISSEGVNNFIDLVDLYWVIQGYGGETAGAIAKKLRINRAVSVLDSSGKVEAKQVSLPVSERIEFLKMLRRDIYRFGMGVNMDMEDERFGASPSGVALKFRYAGLRQKCENMAPRLKKAIKEFFWFVAEDFNRKNGTNYDPSIIRVGINYSQIANDTETVDIIVKSKGIVSRRSLLEAHPFVADANEEERRLEEEMNADEKSGLFEKTAGGEVGKKGGLEA